MEILRAGEHVQVQGGRGAFPLSTERARLVLAIVQAD